MKYEATSKAPFKKYIPRRSSKYPFKVAECVHIEMQAVFRQTNQITRLKRSFSALWRRLQAEQLYYWCYIGCPLCRIWCSQLSPVSSSISSDPHSVSWAASSLYRLPDACGEWGEAGKTGEAAALGRTADSGATAGPGDRAGSSEIDCKSHKLPRTDGWETIKSKFIKPFLLIFRPGFWSKNLQFS